MMLLITLSSVWLIAFVGTRARGLMQTRAMHPLVTLALIVSALRVFALARAKLVRGLGDTGRLWNVVAATGTPNSNLAPALV